MSQGFKLFDLTGRVALVTGGATGIGLAIAKGLAHSGACVYIVSRKIDQLQKAVQEIIAETGNGRVAFGQADIAKRKDTEEIVAQVIAKFGRLDIVIGNAAQDLLVSIEHLNDPEMDQLLEINLTSNMVLTRAAIPELKKHGCGRIIFVTSIAAETGSELGLSVYAATKSGLHAFARTIAFDLGKYGITANCVAPGFTLTAMIGEYFESLGEAGMREKEIMAKTTTLNRMGRPDEMAGPVLMLASDAGSFMTGTVLIVDGGTSIRMR